MSVLEEDALGEDADNVELVCVEEMRSSSGGGAGTAEALDEELSAAQLPAKRPRS